MGSGKGATRRTRAQGVKTRLSEEERLERALMPRGASQVGFLALGDDLSTIIDDDASTLARLGVSHSKLADRLEGLMREAQRQRSGYRVSVPSLPNSIVTAMPSKYMGSQHCPWLELIPEEKMQWHPCQMASSVIGFEIETLDGPDPGAPRYVAGNSLLPHLIRDHHFFQGPTSPHRGDPEMLVRALQMGPWKVV